MFYDHDMLTSRQYGVATIWYLFIRCPPSPSLPNALILLTAINPLRLVATLGSKSNLKKVTRRAILDVDLPKACKTITEPEMPIALRLQGSLLFGISRVYAQQCGYVLTDITSLRDKMRTSENVFKDMALDPEVGKTRPDQLNLVEDPYFIPDIDMNFDLTVFGLSSDGSTTARSGSSFGISSSQSSLLIEDLDDPGHELLPSTETPGGPGGFDADFGIGTSSALRTGSRLERPPSLFDEEPGIIDEPVFDIDDDGFLRPAMSIGMPDTGGFDTPAQPQPGDEAAGSDMGDAERQTPVDTTETNLNFDDDDMMVYGNDEAIIMPPAPLIPLTPEPVDTNVEAQQDMDATSSVHPSVEVSETAEASQRQSRPAKFIRPDQHTELSNRDLNAWNHDYLANMATAVRGRESRQSRFAGMKMAEFWMVQQGIGNISSTFGNDRVEHPLALFSGQSLWDMLQGPGSGTKRSHSSSLDGEDQDEERRVRARTGSQEGLARGQGDDGFQTLDDDGLILQGDELNVESEVGRHAPPSLPDHSASMPWNFSGSRQSSAQPPGSGLHPILSSSAGGLSGGRMDLGPSSAFSRRGSRFTSASPLLGRGHSLSRLGGQENLDPSRLTLNEDDFADLDMQLGADLDPDFELYGPSATVDTQTAAQSQWVAATLENEAFNFLNFVSNQMAARDGEQEDSMGDGEDEGMTSGKATGTLTFNKLLPPVQNSQIVGAQALLHVLALATKGLLQVYQAEPFGEIEIALVSR